MKSIFFAIFTVALLLVGILPLVQPSTPTHHDVPSYTEALYITDVSNPQRLAGLATNVFVGRVVAFQNTHYPDGIPESLFTVEVQENLKGELWGQVTVNQQGGVWQSQAEQKSEPVVHLVNNDPLLVVGQTYLFATLPDKAGRWHTLIPVFGDVLIDDAAERTSLITTYRAAVEGQIPYDPTAYQ